MSKLTENINCRNGGGGGKGDPDLRVRGTGHPDPEIRRGPGLRKKFFSPLWGSVSSKNIHKKQNLK